MIHAALYLLVRVQGRRMYLWMIANIRNRAVLPVDSFHRGCIDYGTVALSSDQGLDRSASTVQRVAVMNSLFPESAPTVRTFSRRARTTNSTRSLPRGS